MGKYIGKVIKDKRGVYIQLPKNLIKDMKLKAGDKINFIFQPTDLKKSP